VPEWYFLPYYAILRVVPNIGIPFTDIVFISSKLAGVLAMFGSILIWFALPWLDKHPVRSGAYRPVFKICFAVFVLCFVILGYVGSQPADAVKFGLPLLIIGRLATLYYFGYFVVILPLLSKKEKTKALPSSVFEATKKKYGDKIVSVLVLVLVFASGSAQASSTGVAEPKQVKWSFNGPLGKFDKQSIQRGFQVYKEVCAACHGVKRVAFRNLQEVGFSEAEVKTLAASYNFTDGPNDSGDMFDRPGRPSDRLPSPFPNMKAAAAANGGAAPPDLSLITKARNDGANYVYSLLTGYDQPKPEHTDIPAGKSYNPYFAGGAISMAKPLNDGQVTFADGTANTTEQMAHDLVSFLQWAAEPEMESRKQTGIKVIIFLLVFTGFFFIAKKRIWSRIGQ
jgi:ubiquinol-cytochrome c reductase cytochrome b/c1 subunit